MPIKKGDKFKNFWFKHHEWFHFWIVHYSNKTSFMIHRPRVFKLIPFFIGTIKSYDLVTYSFFVYEKLGEKIHWQIREKHSFLFQTMYEMYGRVIGTLIKYYPNKSLPIEEGYKIFKTFVSKNLSYFYLTLPYL